MGKGSVFDGKVFCGEGGVCLVRMWKCIWWGSVFDR